MATPDPAPTLPTPPPAPPAEPETSQAESTKPVKRDRAGRVLDGWGLPLAGPARAAKLAKLGRPDPNDDPAAWEAK